MSKVKCPNCKIEFDDKNQRGILNKDKIICPYCGGVWYEENTNKTNLS